MFYFYTFFQDSVTKTLLLPDEELLIKEELERLADDGDGSPPSSLSSRHSHEDDEDKMPEEAFMKYTKDSRTVTPTQGTKPTSAKIAIPCKSLKGIKIYTQKRCLREED